MPTDPATAGEVRARHVLAAIEQILADHEAGGVSGARAASTVGRIFRDYEASLRGDAEDTFLHAAERMRGAAEAFAHRAHVGQTDRVGLPYTKHLARVVARARRHAEAISRKPEFAVLCEQAGWLRGTVEDAGTTADDLRAAGFDVAVVRAVEHLTRPRDIPYPDYVRALIASGDLIAMTVKLAADEDDIDPSRQSISGTPSGQVAHEAWSAALLRSNLLPSSSTDPTVGGGDALD